MKTKLARLTSMALAAIMAMSITSISAFAAEPTTEGFKANANSTWGDAYRYLEPEEFESLPDFVQEQLNYTLVDSQTSDTSLPTPAEARLESGFSIAPMGDMEDVVSATGNIYSQEQGNRIVNSIDINGLMYLLMGASSTKTEIDVTAPLGCTIECPYLYCGVLLKEADGTILAIKSASEADATLCTVDDTFDGLERKTTYTLRAVGVVTPPEGYFTSGNLSVEMDKATK